MTNQRKQALAAGSFSRVQGESTEQTITSSSSVLHRITVTNANAAVQTLTVSDGASPGGDVGVYEIPADDSVTLEFGVIFPSGIRVTPQSADVDALIIYN